MEKIQDKVNQLLRSLAKSMIDKDTAEWPPECLYFMYQPVRPQRIDGSSLESNIMKSTD